MATTLDVSTTSVFALEPARLIATLRLMWRIRHLEEKVEQLFGLGKVHGTMHLSIGQEAIPAGWSLALRDDDYLVNHHRGHGHTLARGADPGRMLAELLGRETGYCRGRGGSMHIADPSRNNMGANGIIGAGMPIAAGLALAVKMQNESRLVLALLGDGAANEGSFHEAMNLSAVWDLPVLFLCENNQYAMSLPIARAMRVTIADRASGGYGIPALRIDGNDVGAVYDAVSNAAEACRAGHGPRLIEAVTYRWRGHSKSDRNLYRTRDEIERWKRHDPIVRFERELTARGLVTLEQARMIEAEARSAIERAAGEALEAPEPLPQELLEGVYA